MNHLPQPPRGDLAADRGRQRRGFWLRTLHQWHWMSSAVSLFGMLLFALTGITLNHASRIEATPQVTNHLAELPAPLLATISVGPDESVAPLPPAVAAWLSDQLSVSIGARAAEWSEEEIYLSMPSPGVDAWLSVDRQTGAMEYESIHRGWLAFFNDLHKGRHAGPAWGWFIDLFAIATVVFCLTGWFLLFVHARQRRMTWPLVGLGLVAPTLLALLLIH